VIKIESVDEPILRLHKHFENVRSAHVSPKHVCAIHCSQKERSEIKVNKIGNGDIFKLELHMNFELDQSMHARTGAKNIMCTSETNIFLTETKFVLPRLEICFNRDPTKMKIKLRGRNPLMMLSVARARIWGP
jgi:hypothetical protein